MAAPMSEDTKQRFEQLLAETMQKELKPLNDKIESLELQLKEAKPMTIHSTNGIIDDGSLQQVGDDMFRLQGGSIINTSFLNINKKGLRRVGSHVFESPGEEMLEFAHKIKSAMQNGEDIRFKEKSMNVDFIFKAPSTVTVTDTIRAADDSSAGLFVPEDIRYALLQIAPPGTIAWPRAQVWPMTTEKIQWPKLVQDPDNDSWFGGVTVTWTEEAGTKQNTRPEFTMMSLDCHEISALAPVTDQLLNDSAINIGNLLVQLFQGAYWHTTDKTFLTGTGGTHPMGVINAPGVNTQSRIEVNKVRPEDLINMAAALPPMYDANAVWFMSKECFMSLRKHKDDNDRFQMELGQGYNDFGEGVAGYILGYPVVMSDYKTENLGTKGDVVLGDWKHYFVGERKTVSIEMSRHFYFAQNTTAFRCSARVGGTPEEPTAFVVLDSTVDASLAS